MRKSKAKKRVTSRTSSESSGSIPKDLLELTRRPKYPFHFAVTLALKNAGKDYVSGREIRHFIHKYIPGWKYKIPGVFTSTIHYNNKVQCKEGVRYCLKKNRMKEFDRRLTWMMKGCTDRNACEYGLADPDDWEPMINGKLQTVGIFDDEQVTPTTPPSATLKKKIKKSLCETDDEQEFDEKQEEDEKDFKDVEKCQNTNKLELRWLFDIAVLRNGNRLASGNIFEFVTKNFPEYRRSHQWKQDLLGMVAADRMKAVKEILDWQTHYIVTDEEIKQFKTFISGFMDKYPDGPSGLDPAVKWDDLVPFELISCVNMYLQMRKTSNGTKLVKKNPQDKEKTPANDEADDKEESKLKKRSIESRRSSSKKSRSPSNKRPKKVEKLPRGHKEWNFSTNRNFLTSSSERAARVAKRDIQKSSAPVYDRPNPLLPRPTTITHVENNAFVPLSTGEQDSEIGSPFDGVFVPPEFIIMSSQFIKSLPQGEENEGQEYPSDLEGIEPAHLLDNTAINNDMFSDEPSMREVVQEGEKTGEQNIEEEQIEERMEEGNIKEQNNEEERIEEENNGEERHNNNNEMSEKQPEENDSSNGDEVSLTATPTTPKFSRANIDSKSNILLKEPSHSMALAKVKLNVKQEFIDNSPATNNDDAGSESSSIVCLGYYDIRGKNDQIEVPNYDSDVIELDGI